MQLRKLKPRLQALASVCDALIQAEAIEHVIDTCCDHGYLGQYLLHTHANITVSFVDILPHICVQLERTLPKYAFYDASRTQILNKDASELNIATDLGICAKKKVLFVVAGVGGDAAIHIVQSLMARHKTHQQTQLFFLVSPSNNMFRLRQALQTGELSLMQEGFVSDRSRGYEYLLLRPSVVNQPLMAIPVIGDFWQFKPTAQCAQTQYVSDLLKHFKRQQTFVNHQKTANHVNVELLELEVNQAIQLYASLLESSSASLDDNLRYRNA